MSENSEIKVTVYLSTYNQEEYVGQALDSIVMQRTTFPVEVIVADDCSTDRTQEIINQYKNKYPDLIRTYYPEKNLGGCRKLTNCVDLGLFRGQYLSYLEGDDYWIGEDRLQILVDFLDDHPEYAAVAHQRDFVNEDGQYFGKDLPEKILNKVYTIEDFLSGEGDYADFGMVFRNYYKEIGNKYHKLLHASRNVCDFQDMFMIQDFGPVYVIDATYSAYRCQRKPGSSNYNTITSQVSRSFDHINICKEIMRFYHEKYDLTPAINSYYKKILECAINEYDQSLVDKLNGMMDSKTKTEIFSEYAYLAIRGKRNKQVSFILDNLNAKQKPAFFLLFGKYSFKRVAYKLTKRNVNSKRRGYVRD